MAPKVHSLQVKQLILKYKNEKKSVRDIAKILNIPKSSVQYILKKFETTGTLQTLPRSGRPCKTSATDDRRITLAVKKKPKVSAREIAEDMQGQGIMISTTTVKRRLHASKFRGYKARCKPLISLKNRKARVAFAEKYLDKPEKFWKQVLWTDETKINLFQHDGKPTVWRKQGKALDPRNTTMSVKHGGGNIKAWACMASSGPGSVVFIDDVNENKSDIMTSETYRTILQQNIAPNAKHLIGRSFWLQSDNDPKHTAKATKAFLSKQKWKLLDWPSQSPDLNPIEHAFYLLKQAVSKKSPKNKGELKKVVQQAWSALPVAKLESLVLSMPRRLRAVIANKGYATKY